jgi:opacity protein-like surface antigen
MIASAASAQLPFIPPGSGSFYLGGEGGWTSLASEFAKARIPVIGIRADGLRSHDGFNAGARLGLDWEPWRIEEEFRYQTSGPQWLVNGRLRSGTRGDYTAAALMSNLIYDFRPGWIVSPHIGAGIGAVQLDSTLTSGTLGQVITGSDWVLGYQAIGGVSYPINPTMTVEVDYRYLGTATPHFRTGKNFVDGGIPAPGISVTSGYDAHSLVASLTVRFGASPPPVAVPPVPPAPLPLARKVFLVFFDWDQDTITSDGMRIIQQAAAAFRAGGPVTIQVTGYTDRSGAPGYNRRLSARRANNVANALSRLGVPRRQMAVSGRGENDNRVPTAPGVREPQNRRVEIVVP